MFYTKYTTKDARAAFRVNILDMEKRYREERKRSKREITRERNDFLFTEFAYIDKELDRLLTEVPSEYREILKRAGHYQFYRTWADAQVELEAMEEQHALDMDAEQQRLYAELRREKAGYSRAQSISDEDLKFLKQFCHPDRHGDDKKDAATRAMAILNSLN